MDTLGLEIVLCRRALALGTEIRTVTCDDWQTLHYDCLIGGHRATARELPGTEDIAAVHTLRTLLAVWTVVW
jgi:hypothetical protein